MKKFFKGITIIAMFLCITQTAFAAALDDSLEGEPAGRNKLNKEFFIALTRLADPDNPPKDLEKEFAEHLNYLYKMEQEGTLFAAGPVDVDTTLVDSVPGYGMIIMRANSFEDARKMMDEEPLHANGIRTYKLLRWVMNEGSFSMKFNMTSQQFTLE